MKNFKRILALSLALIMVIGAFASVSAYNVGSTGYTTWFSEAVGKLQGWGIITADDAAAANRGDKVDRNTFTLWVAKMLAQDVDKIWSTSDDTRYEDVTSGHNTEAINYATSNGIVQGYTTTAPYTFGPDDVLKLGQAAAVVIRFLSRFGGISDYYTSQVNAYKNTLSTVTDEAAYIYVANVSGIIDKTYLDNCTSYLDSAQLTYGEAAYLLYQMAYTSTAVDAELGNDDTDIATALDNAQKGNRVVYGVITNVANLGTTDIVDTITVKLIAGADKAANTLNWTEEFTISSGYVDGGDRITLPKTPVLEGTRDGGVAVNAGTTGDRITYPSGLDYVVGAFVAVSYKGNIEEDVAPLAENVKTVAVTSSVLVDTTMMYTTKYVNGLWMDNNRYASLAFGDSSALDNRKPVLSSVYSEENAVTKFEQAVSGAATYNFTFKGVDYRFVTEYNKDATVNEVIAIDKNGAVMEPKDAYNALLTVAEGTMKFVLRDENGDSKYDYLTFLTDSVKYTIYGVDEGLQLAVKNAYTKGFKYYTTNNPDNNKPLKSGQSSSGTYTYYYVNTTIEGLSANWNIVDNTWATREWVNPYSGGAGSYWNEDHANWSRNKNQIYVYDIDGTLLAPATAYGAITSGKYNLVYMGEHDTHTADLPAYMIQLTETPAAKLNANPADLAAEATATFADYEAKVEALVAAQKALAELGTTKTVAISTQASYNPFGGTLCSNGTVGATATGNETGYISTTLYYAAYDINGNGLTTNGTGSTDGKADKVAIRDFDNKDLTHYVSGGKWKSLTDAAAVPSGANIFVYAADVTEYISAWDEAATAATFIDDATVAETLKAANASYYLVKTETKYGLTYYYFAQTLLASASEAAQQAVTDAQAAVTALDDQTLVAAYTTVKTYADKQIKAAFPNANVAGLGNAISVLDSQRISFCSYEGYTDAASARKWYTNANSINTMYVYDENGDVYTDAVEAYNAITGKNIVILTNIGDNGVTTDTVNYKGNDATRKIYHVRVATAEEEADDTITKYAVTTNWAGVQTWVTDADYNAYFAAVETINAATAEAMDEIKYSSYLLYNQSVKYVAQNASSDGKTKVPATGNYPFALGDKDNSGLTLVVNVPYAAFDGKVFPYYQQVAVTDTNGTAFTQYTGEVIAVNTVTVAGVVATNIYSMTLKLADGTTKDVIINAGNAEDSAWSRSFQYELNGATKTFTVNTMAWNSYLIDGYVVNNQLGFPASNEYRPTWLLQRYLNVAVDADGYAVIVTEGLDTAAGKVDAGIVMGVEATSNTNKFNVTILSTEANTFLDAKTYEVVASLSSAYDYNEYEMINRLCYTKVLTDANPAYAVGYEADVADVLSVQVKTDGNQKYLTAGTDAIAFLNVTFEDNILDMQFNGTASLPNGTAIEPVAPATTHEKEVLPTETNPVVYNYYNTYVEGDFSYVITEYGTTTKTYAYEKAYDTLYSETNIAKKYSLKVDYTDSYTLQQVLNAGVPATKDTKISYTKPGETTATIMTYKQVFDFQNGNSYFYGEHGVLTDAPETRYYVDSTTGYVYTVLDYKGLKYQKNGNEYVVEISSAFTVEGKTETTYIVQNGEVLIADADIINNNFAATALPGNLSIVSHVRDNGNTYTYVPGWYRFQITGTEGASETVNVADNTRIVLITPSTAQVSSVGNVNYTYSETTVGALKAAKANIAVLSYYIGAVDASVGYVTDIVLFGAYATTGTATQPQQPAQEKPVVDENVSIVYLPAASEAKNYVLDTDDIYYVETSMQALDITTGEAVGTLFYYYSTWNYAPEYANKHVHVGTIDGVVEIPGGTLYLIDTRSNAIIADLGKVVTDGEETIDIGYKKDGTSMASWKKKGGMFEFDVTAIKNALSANSGVLSKVSSDASSKYKTFEGYFGTMKITGIVDGKLVATVDGAANVDVTNYNWKFVYFDYEGNEINVATEQAVSKTAYSYADMIALAGGTTLDSAVSTVAKKDTYVQADVEAAVAFANYQNKRTALETAVTSGLFSAIEAAQKEFDAAKAAYDAACDKLEAAQNDIFWSSDVENSKIYQNTIITLLMNNGDKSALTNTMPEFTYFYDYATETYVVYVSTFTNGAPVYFK